MGEWVRRSRTEGSIGRAIWWYLYTVYAPFEDGRVLVKVGISSDPHQRFVSIYCSCPFQVKYAAFTPGGREGMVKRIESRILKEFVEYKTRGEWLLIPSDRDTKKLFASKTARIITEVTKRHVKWTHFNDDQIRAIMTTKLCRTDGESGMVDEVRADYMKKPVAAA